MTIIFRLTGDNATANTGHMSRNTTYMFVLENEHNTTYMFVLENEHNTSYMFFPRKWTQLNKESG